MSWDFVHIYCVAYISEFSKKSDSIGSHFIAFIPYSDIMKQSSML